MRNIWNNDDQQKAIICIKPVFENYTDILRSFNICFYSWNFSVFYKNKMRIYKILQKNTILTEKRSQSELQDWIKKPGYSVMLSMVWRSVMSSVPPCLICHVRHDTINNTPDYMLPQLHCKFSETLVTGDILI